MTYPPEPFKPSKGPTPRTVGLAVFLSAIMVGVAIVGYTLTPASADTKHLSGLCEGLMETRIHSLGMVLNTTGDEQTEYVNRAWAAEKLYSLEDC